MNKETSMPELSRREFLRNAATTAAAAGFLSANALDLRANPLGLPIGCQTWPVREMIAKDFPGTIKQLAAAGFQTIELCSGGLWRLDRKSTRLNSSHRTISYAVFCLKKK